MRSMIAPMLLVAICLSVMSPQPSDAGTPVGLSFGFGVGGFFVQNKAKYMDIALDIYPEMGGYLDISGIQLGATAGFIYRKKDLWWNYCYYDGWDYVCDDAAYEYTVMLIPVQAEIAVLPLRFFKTDFPMQPYLSIGGGAFVPVGDSDYKETEWCASVKLGGESILMDILVMYGDIRYTYADNEMGGVIVTIGGRFRIPLSK